MEAANADAARNAAVFEGLQNVPRIPELDWKNPHSFEEVSMEDRLNPILDQSDVIMVCGAFFGDEGKGKTVDDICQHEGIKLIARVNSGENAGHTVIHGDKKYVFHLAPSGILMDKTNMIGPECVMDPVSFMNVEIQPLIDDNVDYKRNLYIGNVHIVTPYHKLLDLVLSGANASTLKGMSPVHAAKATKRGIRMDHLFNDPAICRARLVKDMETYWAVLARKNITEQQLLELCVSMNTEEAERVPPHVMDFIKATDKADFLMEMYAKHVTQNPRFPARADVFYEIRQCLEAGGKVLLEGPQSYWLSNASEKFWESSTSADTSAGGLLTTARINPARFRTVVLNIHKAPGASRVGIGANPAGYVAQDYFSRQKVETLRQFGEGAFSDFDAIQKAFNAAVQNNGVIKPTIWEENGVKYGIGVAMAAGSALKHGECGATTLKPRVCGLFDCVLHSEVNKVQGPYLSISALDRGDDYDQIGTVIAYAYYNPAGKDGESNGRSYKNGDIIKSGDPIPTEQVLANCHPILIMTQGWKNSPLYRKKRKVGDPLPQGVQDFLGVVEHFTGSQILSVGNGPNRGDFVYVKRVVVPDPQ